MRNLLVSLALVALFTSACGGSASKSATSSPSSKYWSGKTQPLRPLWHFPTHGAIAAAATVAGKTVYVGSWDGYEYALDARTGKLRWKSFLGVTPPLRGCALPPVGISSTGALLKDTLYVGGGGDYWYALDNRTGHVRWRVFTGRTGTRAGEGNYNWSSPLIYRGSAYIGIASLGDCPEVQGKLLRVDLTTHKIAAVFNVVPKGQLGGGIWSSPVVDPATNTVFVTTGNPRHPDNPCGQIFAPAIVGLDAASLEAKGFWQLPPAQQTADGDWGTSPTFFTDEKGNHLVAAINKAGLAYAFRRNHLGDGPLWVKQIAVGGDNPLGGQGSVSTPAFGDNLLYVAGGMTNAGHTVSQGAVRAFDPGNGATRWLYPALGTVIGRLTFAGHFVIASAGPKMVLLDSRSGKVGLAFQTRGPIYAGAAVGLNRIFQGSTDGKLYAFRLPRPLRLPPAVLSKSMSHSPPATSTPTPRSDFFHVSYKPVHQPHVFKSCSTMKWGVLLQNRGKVTWPGGNNQMGLNVHFANRGGGFQVNSPWVVSQVFYLPSLRPGKKVGLTVQIAAPRVPGKYILEYDMEQLPYTHSSEVLDTRVEVRR